MTGPGRYDLKAAEIKKPTYFNQGTEMANTDMQCKHKTTKQTIPAPFCMAYQNWSEVWKNVDCSDESGQIWNKQHEHDFIDSFIF